MVIYSLAIVTVCLLLFCVWEQLRPAQELAKVEGWFIRLPLMNLLSLISVSAIAYLWPQLNISWSLLKLRDLHHPIAIGFLAYCLVGFINYWWHRARHTNKHLWLWFHQIHHSASRIQALTTYYRNPLDTIVQDMLGAVFMFMILGVGVDELMVTAALTTVIEVYFHANINVPLWMSYIVQSPQSHRIHHMRGQHFYNLGDIPILTDIPFGTFKNQPDVPGPIVCGFEPHQEKRLIQMMLNEDSQSVQAHEPSLDTATS